MNIYIYIINKLTKTTEKIIPYMSISKIRYDAKEYTKLMKSYDSDVHAIYLANSKYYDFEIVDGEVVEIKEVIEVVESTTEEKISSLEQEITEKDAEITKMQSDISAKAIVGRSITTLESELEILVAEHSDLCFDLFMLEIEQI